jgi:hypothetical protein
LIFSFTCWIIKTRSSSGKPRALSQLARVDAEDKFTAIFDKHFAPIRGPVMITAAHVIRGGARIAAAKPHLADRIAAEVMKVDRGR